MMPMPCGEAWWPTFIRDHTSERERLITTNPARSRHLTWANVVGKWTAPLITLENVLKITDGNAKTRTPSTTPAKAGVNGEVPSKN